MRNISVEKLSPGMEVAKSIHNTQGNILIAAGEKLTAGNIKRLKQLGITSIYVHLEGEPRLEVPDPISDQRRNELVQEVKQAVKSTLDDNHLNSEVVSNTAKEIIEEILNQDEVIFHLRDIRSHDNYIFSHLVSVAVLSVTIAAEFNYGKKKLKQIAVGALLHDIGLIMLDKEIHRGTSRQQHEKYKQHARYGYDILKDAPGISLLSAHVAYQHHEKLDGTGYPRNLAGDNIHEFAQLVGVANIYDKLTNPKPRNNKKKLPPHKALKFLERLQGNKLKAKFVTALQDHIASYPLGTQVSLNTGEFAVVTGVHSQDLASPIVKILQEQPGGKVEAVKEIDLLENSQLKIEKVID